MFGSRRAIGKLERELAELRAEVGAMRAELSRIGRPFSEGERIARSRAESERTQGEAAGADAATRPEVAPLPGVRRKVPLDCVERAAVTGYVSIMFDGGRTDTVRLLVGSGESPEACVGEASSGGGGNAYVGGVVRAGEYWQAQSTVGASKSGFVCWFTPLY